MAKSQKKNGREVKKPKQNKKPAPGPASSPSKTQPRSPA
jgi:hypothetical protein